MRCPKCGYLSFDTQSECGKCGENVSVVAAALAGTAVKVRSSFFLAPVVALQKGEDELADTLAILPEVAEVNDAEGEELGASETMPGTMESEISLPGEEKAPLEEGVPMIDLSQFTDLAEAEEERPAVPDEGLSLEELAAEIELPLAELDLAEAQTSVDQSVAPLAVAEVGGEPEEISLELERKEEVAPVPPVEAPLALEVEGAEYTLELDELAGETEELTPAAEVVEAAVEAELEPTSSGVVDLEEIDLSDLVVADAASNTAELPVTSGEEEDLTVAEQGDDFSSLDFEGGEESELETRDDILDLDFVPGGQQTEGQGEDELQGIDLSMGDQDDIFDLLLETGGEAEEKPKKAPEPPPPEIPDLGLTLEKDAK